MKCRRITVEIEKVKRDDAETDGLCIGVERRDMRVVK